MQRFLEDADEVGGGVVQASFRVLNKWYLLPYGAPRAYEVEHPLPIPLRTFHIRPVAFCASLLLVPPNTIHTVSPPSVLLDTAKPLLCPGVPAEPPPTLADYEVREEETGSSSSRRRTIRFGDEEEQQEQSEPAVPGAAQPNSLQKKMLAMAGQDIDQFMKEMEEVSVGGGRWGGAWWGFC